MKIAESCYYSSSFHLLI